jgi:hypothetical protein
MFYQVKHLMGMSTFPSKHVSTVTTKEFSLLTYSFLNLSVKTVQKKIVTEIWKFPKWQLFLLHMYKSSQT